MPPVPIDRGEVWLSDLGMTAKVPWASKTRPTLPDYFRRLHEPAVG